MEIMVKDNLTLYQVANNPSAYQPEVKAASLDLIKMLEITLREMKLAISLNVISEMAIDHASKIFFINVKDEKHVLTLKSAGKVLNKNIKDMERFIVESGFHNLLEPKVVPVSWSKAKELRKLGGKIQEVIDQIYVDDKQSIEIK